MSVQQTTVSGRPVYESARLRFLGVDGFDVYNCSVPFTWHGETYLFGRVEPRDQWADSYSLLFRRREQDTYELVERSRQYQLEDPYIFIHDGEMVLGGTHVVKSRGEIAEIVSYFYCGTDPFCLRYFTSGPSGMKDIRLVDLADGKIGLFTRPRSQEILKQYGSESMIGFAEMESLDELDSDAVNGAELIHGIFENGQWGGCNQAYLLDDGTVGVIGHLSNTVHRTEGVDQLSYRNMSFTFDPGTREASHLQVIAGRGDYPAGPAKMPNLEDCAFTTGITRRPDGKVNLYSGLGDCEEGRVVIDDPFAGRKVLSSLTLA